VTLRLSAGAAVLLFLASGRPVLAAPDDASPARSVFVAIYAGPAASIVRTPDHPVHSTQARVGGSAGILVAIPRNRHSSLQLGTMIRTAGGAYSYDLFDQLSRPHSPRRVSVQLTYLAFPVGFRVYPVSQTSGPYLAMGADLAYLLTYYQRVRVPYSNAVFSDHGRSVAYNWGLAGFVSIGAALSFARHRLFGEVTYRHGFPPFERSCWCAGPDDGTDRAVTLSFGAWL
jgi:hypothetical protein